MMHLNNLKLNSIKTRVTLFTLALFIVSIWLLALNASSKLQNDMAQQIGEQQLSSTALLAREINDDLQERIITLENLSEKIARIGLNKPIVAQLFLEDRFVIRRDYNAGAFITDINGNVIATVPDTIQRHGQNYRAVDSVDAVLKHGTSGISGIITDKALRQRMFYIAVPIRNSAGKVIGAFVGVTNLSTSSFLDKITNSHYGKSGYYLLEDQKSRLIITSTDRRRVLKQQLAKGKNALIDRHLEGFEESGISVNAYGVEVLASAKRIALANWVIVSALPTEEAFAPIKKMQYRIVFYAVLMTIIVGVLTWLLLRRELFPVFTTIKKLSMLSESLKETELVSVKSNGEIGELITAFNTLLQKLKQRENALTESEFRWKFAIEGAGDGLWDWDIKSNKVFYSKKWKQQLGYAEDEIGDSLEEWEKRIHPEDKASTFAAVKNHFEGLTASYATEHRLLCKDGSYKWILTRGLIVSVDADGKPLRAIGTHTDITERQQMMEIIRHQALFDTLTQLPNRRLFEDHLTQAMAASKRYNNYGALMFIDLDNFKPLNDSHGHEMGDILLKEVAIRLKSCVRETDTVARVGGDEFVVALSQLYVDKETSKQQALMLAEKIRTALAKPYLMDKMDATGASVKIEHHCTASIGLTLFKGEKSSMSDVLRHADLAMYEAKSAGRNQVQYYDSTEKI
jgi:diguanylate cyclase (GGDEF)-like protein/PAS domain S-box-containing protein